MKIIIIDAACQPRNQQTLLGIAKEAGDFIVGICLFSFSPRNIAIKSVITSHLLALVGHMGAHGSQCLYPVALCGAIPVRRIIQAGIDE